MRAGRRGTIHDPGVLPTLRLSSLVADRFGPSPDFLPDCLAVIRPADQADKSTTPRRPGPTSVKRLVASRGQFGAKATPHGNSPTWIDLMTFCFATSITETSLETPFATTRYFSSGVKSPCQTRCPTSRYFATLWVAPSTTATRLAGPRSMNPHLPSLVRLMPTGWISSARSPGTSNRTIVLIFLLAGSMIVNSPPTSEVTQSSDPSDL